MRDFKLDDSRSTLWDRIDSALGKWETQCLVAGAILGWIIGWYYKGFLLISPAHLVPVVEGFGEGFITYLHYISAAFGAFTAFVFGRIIASWIYHASPSEEEMAADRKQRKYIYKLPPWPKTKKLSFVVGESHRQNGDYIPNPTWATIPQDGLFGNIFVAGGIGSGKTASCAYPFIEQILEFHPNDKHLKPCGLILDRKGDFYKTLEKMAKAVGRENDIIRIEVGGDNTWNPIHAPNSMAEVLAGRLVSLYENLKGSSSSGSDQWVKDGMLKILKHGIGLHRIAYGYITVKDINDMVANMSGEGEGDDNPVLKTLVKYDNQLANRKSREKLSVDEEADYQYHKQFFERELAHENVENKATYLGSVTTITDLFSKPAVAKTFCPPRNKITLGGFDGILDSGKIIVLNAPHEILGNISIALGVMLKLEFQRSILGRVSREAKDDSLNKERIAFFICDEYQNFVTVSGNNSNEGDDQFYAESRQSRCVSMVLTQSIATLISKIGAEKAEVILASLRTKIFMSVVPYKDQRAAAEICGKSLQMMKTQSFSENLKDSSFNPLSGDVSGSSGSMSSNVSFQERHEYIVQPSEFGNLRSFESVSFVFNGVSAEAPKRIYHKSEYLPEVFRGKFTKRTIPFKLLSDEMVRANNEKEEPKK